MSESMQSSVFADTTMPWMSVFTQALYSEVSAQKSHEAPITVINKVKYITAVASERTQLPNPDLENCDRDYAALCPLGWADSGDGVSCVASEFISYVSDCSNTISVGNLTPLEKVHIENRCQVQWPCVQECVRDYSNLCPLHWTEKNGSCAPPKKYTGPCSALAGAPTQFLMRGAGIAQKEVFANYCQAPYPCRLACDVDYDARVCPLGWTLTESYSATEKGTCVAPASYRGLCDGSFSVDMLSSVEAKRTVSRGCAVHWPCKAVLVNDLHSDVCPLGWSSVRDRCYPPRGYIAKSVHCLTIDKTLSVVAKKNIMHECSVSYPFIESATISSNAFCEKGFSSRCPMAWTWDVNEELCIAPVSYKGPCMRRFNGEKWSLDAKKAFQGRCDAPWPCSGTAVSVALKQSEIINNALQNSQLNKNGPVLEASGYVLDPTSKLTIDQQMYLNDNAYSNINALLPQQTHNELEKQRKVQQLQDDQKYKQKQKEYLQHQNQNPTPASAFVQVDGSVAHERNDDYLLDAHDFTEEPITSSKFYDQVLEKEFFSLDVGTGEASGLSEDFFNNLDSKRQREVLAIIASASKFDPFFKRQVQDATAWQKDVMTPSANYISSSFDGVQQPSISTYDGSISQRQVTPESLQSFHDRLHRRHNIDSVLEKVLTFQDQQKKHQKHITTNAQNINSNIHRSGNGLASFDDVIDKMKLHDFKRLRSVSRSYKDDMNAFEGYQLSAQERYNVQRALNIASSKRNGETIVENNIQKNIRTSSSISSSFLETGDATSILSSLSSAAAGEGTTFDPSQLTSMLSNVVPNTNSNNAEEDEDEIVYGAKEKVTEDPEQALDEHEKLLEAQTKQFEEDTQKTNSLAYQRALKEMGITEEEFKAGGKLPINNTENSDSVGNKANRRDNDDDDDVNAEADPEWWLFGEDYRLGENYKHRLENNFAISPDLVIARKYEGHDDLNRFDSKLLKTLSESVNFVDQHDSNPVSQLCERDYSVTACPVDWTPLDEQGLCRSPVGYAFNRNSLPNEPFNSHLNYNDVESITYPFRHMYRGAINPSLPKTIDQLSQEYYDESAAVANAALTICSGSTIDFGGMTRRQKMIFERTCHVQFPCVQCEPDYFRYACPLGWTYRLDGRCYAFGVLPVLQWNSPFKCELVMDFRRFSIDQRKRWAQMCRQQWPCIGDAIIPSDPLSIGAPLQNYARNCPENWVFERYILAEANDNDEYAHSNTSTNNDNDNDGSNSIEKEEGGEESDSNEPQVVWGQSYEEWLEKQISRTKAAFNNKELINENQNDKIWDLKHYETLVKEDSDVVEGILDLTTHTVSEFDKQQKNDSFISQTFTIDHERNKNALDQERDLEELQQMYQQSLKEFDELQKENDDNDVEKESFSTALTDVLSKKIESSGLALAKSLRKVLMQKKYLQTVNEDDEAAMDEEYILSHSTAPLSKLIQYFIQTPIFKSHQERFARTHHTKSDATTVNTTLDGGHDANLPMTVFDEDLLENTPFNDGQQQQQASFKNKDDVVSEFIKLVSNEKFNSQMHNPLIPKATGLQGYKSVQIFTDNPPFTNEINNNSLNAANVNYKDVNFVYGQLVDPSKRLTSVCRASPSLYNGPCPMRLAMPLSVAGKRFLATECGLTWRPLPTPNLVDSTYIFDDETDMVGVCRLQHSENVCPWKWVFDDSSEECVAPDSYKGICPRRINFMTMSPSKRKETSAACQILWPCEEFYDDEHDFSNPHLPFACPLQDFNASPCPLRWTLEKVETSKTLKEFYSVDDAVFCVPPATYKGPCPNVAYSFKDYDSSMKEEFATKCMVNWPCRKLPTATMNTSKSGHNIYNNNLAFSSVRNSGRLNFTNEEKRKERENGFFNPALKQYFDVRLNIDNFHIVDDKNHHEATTARTKQNSFYNEMRNTIDDKSSKHDNPYRHSIKV